MKGAILPVNLVAWEPACESSDRLGCELEGGVEGCAGSAEGAGTTLTGLLSLAGTTGFTGCDRATDGL